MTTAVLSTGILEGRKLETLGVGGKIVMLRDIGWLNVGWI